ncbi:uncharacterized protein LOC126745131 [Anthonomus grandis grandis]|uniref:uncharacterized protein LOC126745131 n=1 Tax=Anthonomus grandis grandis TaxID=2921223 RepID=UPI0021662F14|nr:uncharacterized protein LOC126745131 [Anthonomus grandis grandis]
MSNEGSGSQSEDSSNSSSSQVSSFHDGVDLTLFGSSEATFARSGTVVRRGTAPFRKDRVESTSSTEDDECTPAEKYRREPQYRHSLAAISERRSARNSLSNESGKTYRACQSMEATSELSEYLKRTLERKMTRNVSPASSSYLSWIESVNSEHFSSAISSESGQDADSKVGEWNNFWLNYSTARLRHLSTEETFGSEIRSDPEENSDDHKSDDSNPKDSTDKNSLECVTLTIEEMQETIRCSQRITEILQTALRRSDTEEGSNESYYSQQHSNKNSAPSDEVPAITILNNRERSISCVETQRQKMMLKPAVQQQSSSTSCIDAILNNSVTDIFRKVIARRREVTSSETDNRSVSRSSFSEWSGR